MEQNKAEKKATFGPLYMSHSQAMKAFCVPSMKGTFYAGRPVKVDGTLVMSTAVELVRQPGVTDAWFAEITYRPLTEVEAAAVETRRREERIKTLCAVIGGNWTNVDGNPRIADAINEYRELTAR